MEMVFATEYWSWNQTISCIPDRKSITKELLPFACHFEIYIHLPILWHAWLQQQKKTTRNISLL